MNTLLPFFSPTQVLLIDDNYDTLDRLKNSLNPAIASYKALDNPFKAVEYINQSSSNVSYNQVVQSAESLLSGHIESFYEEIYATSRFQQISTMIVDYDMPGMNGIEVCQSINSPHIQKIILTGAASEKLAIDAFNAKDIDYFIEKHDPEVLQKLEDLIVQTQNKYFYSLTRHLTNIISYESLESMGITDPIFIEFFYRFINEKKICEYYLLDSIGTFLFLSADGEPSALFVFDDMLLMGQEEMIPPEERTDDLLEDLDNHRKAICHHHFKHGHEYKILEWKDLIYPLSILPGRETYYWAYAPRLPYFKKDDIISFKKYTQSLFD
ncbi:response regulator [Candidatus Paracaedibacter symbiosus]|uniref:response regulator n=1 Tax=Candidatus Paracaedibacter symbiosus TaxID=244582 RepID=UPI00050970DF|nr:response regulator [Candidatus Paracaedibacter symbiosus]